VNAEAEAAERARGLCLDRLAVRARTRAELTQALERAGLGGPEGAAVLDRLTEVGLVDDAAFARAWVAERRERRGLSRVHLAAELRRRGVSDDDAAPALAELTDEGDVAAATRLLASRLPATSRLPREAAYRRLTGVLARRGFSQGLATRLVLEALDAPPGDRWVSQG
jgi:regulatory protein